MRNYSYSVLFFIPFMLFLVLAFAQSSFAADPNDFRKPNNWQRERTINDSVNKSSVKVEAQKTYPVSTLDQNGKPIKQIRNAKATIKLGANAGNVGKSLLKRAPAIAITQAVIAILGKSVDWVLDPENNSVKYKESDDDTCEFFYSPYHAQNDNYCSPAQACNVGYNKFYSQNGYLSINTSYVEPNRCKVTFKVAGSDSLNTSYQDLIKKKNPDFGQTPVDEWKRIPISDVAAKVINHAEDGQAPAMQVMNDAALDALEAGLLDAQLDAASNVPQPDPQEITQAQYDNPDYPENGTGSGTGPETPVDPETPTDPVDPNPNPNPDANPFQLPPFCSWASKVCDFIDWVQTEPPEPPESGEVDVQIPDSNMHEGILERLYINMPAQCPPDPILEFMGAKIPFPMSIFCQFAEMMKPLILLFAYIKGLSIIGNGLT